MEAHLLLSKFTSAPDVESEGIYDLATDSRLSRRHDNVEVKVDALIKSASTKAIIKILEKIPEHYKLTALEEFGIRVAVKKLKNQDLDKIFGTHEEKTLPNHSPDKTT